ncbi:MAG: MIP/aquaporin family protein [Candidatus Limnocylindria bacterium]
MNTRAYVAELLGTFLFFGIGYLSVAAFGGTAGVPGLLVVPFSFGFGLLAAIFAFGHVSGGHFNPAVTIAAVIDGRTSVQDAAGYIVAQVVGAIAAGLFVLIAISQDAVAAGTTLPGDGVSEIGALIIEIVLAAGFIVVILAATTHARALAPLAIPLALVAIHFAAATLSGASVNPARSLGSALVGGNLDSIWIYLVGPTIGGVLGALVYRFAASEAMEPSGPTEAPAGGSAA